MEDVLINEAVVVCSELQPVQDIPFATDLGPRFPAFPFSYQFQLNMNSSFPVSNIEDYGNVISCLFRGAVRPESTNFLLNIHPLPDVQGLAAACLAIYYNMDGLMDEYSGEALLVEQQIVREIGSWVGWSNASGTATAGGKLTTLYAIRTALSRASHEYLNTGIPNKTIVIASEGAHYSLRHTLGIVGLGIDNCWTIPMDKNKSMDCSILASTLRRAWEGGYTVAAIICCGGSTVDFHCDNLQEVYDVATEIAREYPAQPRPYFHTDSVIGWQYLAVAALSNIENKSLLMSDDTQTRILQAYKRLEGIKAFDSFGADFHKNGLCPIASSFFVSRDNQFMNDLSLEDENCHFDIENLGQHRPYRYTIENSRTLHGVFSAWIVLTRLGRIGIAKYLVELHSSREAFETAINASTYMETTKSSSLGWEVLFHICTKKNAHSQVIGPAVTRDFANYCAELVYQGYNIPLFGFVPSENDCSLLIYPMRYYSPAEAQEIVKNISTLWTRFCNTAVADRSKFLFSNSNNPVI